MTKELPKSAWFDGTGTLVFLGVFFLANLVLLNLVFSQTRERGIDTRKQRDAYSREATYWRAMLSDEHGVVPPDGLKIAYDRVQEMRASQRLDGGGISGPGSWTSLGPGNIGGRVRSIVPHPTDPNTIWIGSVGGGVFKTNNGGASWTATSDFMANLAVTSLVLDPTDGTSNTLYAGTGEGFSDFADWRYIDAIQGAGIFRTINGGTNWIQLGGTNTSDFYYVNRVALSANGNALLAATTTGLWLNPDVKNGTTWTRVLNPGSRIAFVAFNPSDNTKAVAGGYGLAWYVSAGDARTTGATWTGSVLPSLGGIWSERVELAYAPSDPTIIYGSIDDTGGRIVKSTDGGANYFLRYVTPDPFGEYLDDLGGFVNMIWVSPRDPNFILVSGVSIWRSTDGGTTLTQTGMRFNNHIVVADPGFYNNTNNKVYIGNDAGVYKVDDIVASSNWTSLTTNLPLTLFYSVAGHYPSGKIAGGTVNNGTLGYTGNANAWVDWTGGYGGYAGFVAADNTDATGNTWYGEYMVLQVQRTTTGFTPYAPYITTSGCGNLGDAGYSALYVAPFVLDPNNANRMLAGGSRLWLSSNVKDATPCWSPITTAGAQISAIAVAQGNSNIIWVGHSDGIVEMTSNGGGSWSFVGGGTLPARFITRIAIDPNNSNNVYVTYGGYRSCCYTNGNIWRTTNAGGSWTDISGGLPPMPVFSVTVNPGNSNWLYIGTILGVFDSQNGLEANPSWSVNDGPANVATVDLSWMQTATEFRLLAATHGRGIWITNSLSPVPIQLSSFTVRRLSTQSVQLNWSTISEVNNYGFDIQRSDTSRQNYQTIPNSFTPGHGTTNVPQHYSWISGMDSSVWYYRLKQTDLDGTVHYTDGIRVSMLTEVNEKEIPTEFSLKQNYPNPFNPTTTITYTLARPAQVTLTISNSLGQLVATLVNGQQSPNTYHIDWRAEGLASGVYFCRLQAGDFVAINKLVLLR